jgi:TRAP-type uncharacterized transport system fused permease subunit
MSGRFNVFPVLRGHWKGLTVENDGELQPDILARMILLVPVIVCVLTLALGWQLRAPAAILSGVALLAGGLLAAFAQLSSLRLKLTEWQDHPEDAGRIDREMIDETVAHLLMAALLCAVDAIVLVIGMNVSSGVNSAVTGIWASLALAISSYIILLFILALPRLYSAYVEINRVRPELSGFSRGKW